MNITPSLIYWISRLDEVQATFTVAGFITAIVLIVLSILIGMAKCDCEEDSEKAFKLSFRKILIVFIISVFGSILVPTSREMAAAVVIPKIANSEQMQNIGDGIYNLALEWMEELSPKNSKNKK